MFLSTLPTSSSLLCLLCLLLLPNALAEKNWTQWSAITGTWTAQSNIDLGIGDMKLGIVMFMGPDSLGQQKQTCLGPGTCGDGEQYQDGGVCPGPCDTMNNNTICLQTTFPDGGHHEDQPYAHKKTCADMSNSSSIVTGADMNVWFHMSVKYGIHTTFPKYDVDMEYSTGEWLGPFSVMLPDDGDIFDGSGATHTAMRFVKSKSSEALYPPDDYTFTTGPGEFESVFGQDALDRTIEIQHTDDINDPFKQQKNTCNNGDAQPVLPVFDFFWDENPGVDKDGNAKPNLSVFLFPPPSAATTYGMPVLGFDGPYCFQGENKGWAFDFNFDTNNIPDDTKFSFSKGCVIDADPALPCTPDVYDAFGDLGNQQTIHNDPATQVDVKKTVYFIASTAVLALAFLVLFVVICCMGRKLKRQGVELKEFKRESERKNGLLVDHASGTGGNYSALKEDKV
ncbi:hypothetical protein TL16_g05030 [Triparma laevis f. inornata]|uniref:Uncharacterized protein n=1 Tax=Triparma laevis f. inornata TaxID=1714386 RepID=A0A9W7AGB5_9STRA|nr:hypothetical protein TL16_g05030 [Triparma laevis f. inornata]